MAFVGGTDIDVVRTDAGTITINSTFTETPQFVLQTVNSDGGSYVAQSAVDEFSIIGGTGITTSKWFKMSCCFNGTNIASMGFRSGVDQSHLFRCSTSRQSNPLFQQNKQ